MCYRDGCPAQLGSGVWVAGERRFAVYLEKIDIPANAPHFDTWLGGGDASRLTVDWACVAGIITAGAIPGLAMIVMLRRGVPLAPHLTVLLGAFASSAIGDVGLRLFHPQDAGLMVLVWQFGGVMLLSVLAALGGRHMLN